MIILGSKRGFKQMGSNKFSLCVFQTFEFDTICANMRESIRFLAKKWLIVNALIRTLFIDKNGFLSPCEQILHFPLYSQLVRNVTGSIRIYNSEGNNINIKKFSIKRVSNTSLDTTVCCTPNAELVILKQLHTRS